MNTLMSPGYSIINTYLRHIAPLLIPQASKTTKGGNEMDSKSDEKFIIIQSTIEVKRQEMDEKKINTDEKLTNITEDLRFLTPTITSMMDQTKYSKFSLDQKDTSNPPEPTTVVPVNRRAPPLDGGNYEKMVACGISNMRSAHQNSMNYS